MEIPTKPMKRSTNLLKGDQLTNHKERARVLANILQCRYWNACPQFEY